MKVKYVNGDVVEYTVIEVVDFETMKGIAKDGTNDTFKVNDIIEIK